MNKKAVYKAPEVNVITLGHESVICNSLGPNGLDDYIYGGLDETVGNDPNLLIPTFEEEPNLTIPDL